MSGSGLVPARGLGPAGRALWRRLTAAPEAVDGEELTLEFSSGELVLLEQAAKAADGLAALETQLRREGLTVTGSKGQPRLSGLPAEIRLQRAALTRLVSGLAIPVGEEMSGLSPAGRRAQKAAQARWRRVEQKRETRHGRTA